MSQEVSQKIKLGVFVTAGLFLLALALYLVGNQRNMFSTRFPLNTHFSEVSGLRQGGNVRFAGIDVGTVSKITIINDTTVRVDMLLREEVQNHIKKNAIATIGTDGLVGNVIINIKAGYGDALPIEANDQIASQPNVDTDALLQTLSVSNENLARLTQNLVSITDQVNAGRGALGVMLKDDHLANDLQQTLANLSQASAKTTTTFTKLESIADKIGDGPGIISFLTEDTTTVWQLQQTMNNLQSASTVVTEITTDLQRLTEQVESGQGTAGLLISDTAFAEDIQQSVDEIQTGISLFNENMEALRHNFLLRRYFKKQAKKAEE